MTLEELLAELNKLKAKLLQLEETFAKERDPELRKKLDESVSKYEAKIEELKAELAKKKDKDPEIPPEAKPSGAKPGGKNFWQWLGFEE